jgi:hypothetical protein
MMRAQASRTDFFQLSTLDQMFGDHRPLRSHSQIRESEVAWRYRFTDEERMKNFDSMDPVKYYEHLVQSSKKMLRKDKSLARVMLLRNGRGRWSGHMIMAANRLEKYLLMHSVAQTVREEGCDALLEVGETWIVPTAHMKDVFTDSVLQVRDKEEAIFVHLATRDGLSKTARTVFKRGPFGGISFSDTSEIDGQAYHYLKPVYQVWLQQNQFERSRGQKLLLWHPEYSDLCLCGSDLPYGVCCLPVLDGADGPLKNSDDLLEAGNLEEAERHARAGLTRYARWVRQQTASWLNSSHRELSERIIPTDALALEACLAKLERCVTSTGNLDAISRACSRLEEFIGVPVIARRLIALGARWLIRHGRVEEGLLELGRLGKPSEMSDTQALILEVRYGDHEPKDEIRLLRTAAKFALCDEERLSTLLRLADRLGMQGSLSEAMTTVDQVLKESHDQTITRGARALKWELSGDNDDFENLFSLMKAEEDDEDRLAAASFLISHQKERAALDLLKPLLEQDNQEANLLAVESDIRLGKCSDAAERLGSMKVDTSSPLHLRSGFALAHGMLVLECGREDLRKSSTQRIKDILSIEQVPVLAELLTALDI